MQLTIKRGNLVLSTGADWEEGIQTGDMPDDVERAMEVIALLGAEGVSVFDRATLSHKSEFTITRIHADPGAALIFAKMHDKLVTGRAHLVFHWTTVGTTYTLKSANCAWLGLRRNVVGCSTDITYVVEGPPFTLSTTAGPVEEEDYIEGGDGFDVSYGPLVGVLDGGHYGDAGVPAALAVHSPEYA